MSNRKATCSILPLLRTSFVLCDDDNRVGMSEGRRRRGEDCCIAKGIRISPEKTTVFFFILSGSSQITWINECIEQGTMICALLDAAMAEE